MARSEPLSRVEFIALTGFLFATIAFAMDAMLPALPQIAEELTPDAPNRAQLILTSFFIGMALGTFFMGPLSDAFGRKPVVLWCSVVFIIGAGLVWMSTTLEGVLAARVLQGIGAAGPRVVTQAIIRDRYEGRDMAQIMSFVLLVFALIPALAPAVGAAIIAIADWRAIFLAFMLFSVVTVSWLMLRQPETLPRDRRRPFRLKPLAEGLREVLNNRQVVLAMLALTLVFGMLLTTLISAQPILEEAFGRGDELPFWFAMTIVVAASGNLINSGVVQRFGMRWVVLVTLTAQAGLGLCALMFGLFAGWDHALAFPVYFVWMTTIFLSIGLTIGNLNALALTPLGHLAGMGASIVGGISMLLSTAICVPLGLAFNGTPFPAMIGVAISALLAIGIVWKTKD